MRRERRKEKGEKEEEKIEWSGRWGREGKRKDERGSMSVYGRRFVWCMH
jgi:hypothetical protein